jgi:mono/diheme cytochrome c family protein
MIDAIFRLFAGLGFGDPLHPPVTHLPIGLAAGALVFILVALIFKKKNLEMTARHVSILAFIFAFPTILLGVMDWIHFYKGVLFPAIQVKIVLATILVAALAAGIFLGPRLKFRSVFTTALAAVAFVAVFGLGYFGSGILYGRGIAAAPAAPTPQEALNTHGETVFMNNCSACHAGGGNAIQANLPLKTSVKLKSADDFIAFIRDPVPPAGIQANMPPFPADIIDDAAARDLYAYVRYMAAAKWK